MQLWFWIVIGVAFKLPVFGLCWLCWHAIKDPPDQVLGDDDGGLGSPFEQGPRLRGPRSELKRGAKKGRRADPGHQEAPPPLPAPAGHSRDALRRRD